MFAICYPSYDLFYLDKLRSTGSKFIVKIDKKNLRSIETNDFIGKVKSSVKPNFMHFLLVQNSKSKRLIQ